MFLIARVVAIVAFVGFSGGLGLILTGLVGALARFFPLLAARARLVKSLGTEHPELLRHMRESSFSSWLGLHRELINLPHELVTAGTDELRLEARQYGQHYAQFNLYLKCIGFGTLTLIIGLLASFTVTRLLYY